MKPLTIGTLLLLLLAACVPTATPTPTASPSPTPTGTALSVAQDDIALYRSDLVDANLYDVDGLDRPTRYALALTYDKATTTLSGAESVRYFNRQTAALKEIYFRLFANYPDSGGKIVINTLTVDGAPVTPVYEVQNTALKVPLVQPLAPGGLSAIDISFTVTVGRNSKGHYADFTASDTVVTLPSVYPLIPAHDSAGWHIELPPAYGDLVYADVSLYKVAVTVPTDMTVIASGSTLSTKDNGNGTTTWNLVGAPMRDFDINLTDKLKKVSSQLGDTTVNSWYEAADTTRGNNALEYAVDALRDYQNRFGAYPYKELDVVETPTTAGGIEYPGIIVIGNNLYKDPSQRSYFEFATVHEVAHQWWYGVVGDDQVNYPWVDEATAQYSSYIYMEDVHGKATAQTIMRQVFTGPYQDAKSHGRDAAVNQSVSAFDEAQYAAIVYGKAPLFYDAIRQKMGDDKFFKFFQAYYKAFRYKIAFPQDILNTAESTCGCSLQDEYKQWITSPSK